MQYYGIENSYPKCGGTIFKEKQADEVQPSFVVNLQ